MNEWKKFVLFSPGGEYVGIVEGGKTTFYHKRERSFVVSEKAVAVSDKGNVIVKSPNHHAYLILRSGEKIPLPLLDLPHIYTYCFAVESLESTKEGDEQWEIGGETIIAVQGNYAEHRPPFLLIQDNAGYDVRYRNQVMWSIFAPVGVGGAVFYADRADVYLFTPPVGIYYCTLPSYVREISVGKTMVAVLCNNDAVYVFPAVSKLPASPVRVATGIASIHWGIGKDLVCVAWDKTITTHHFPEQEEPDFYVPEEMMIWGTRLYSDEEVTE